MLLGFLKNKREKHYLDVERTKNLFKYGFLSVTLEKATSSEIDALESVIKSKAGSGSRLLTQVYPETKLELVEQVNSHFKEEGFVTDIYKNNDVPGFVVLVVGW